MEPELREWGTDKALYPLVDAYRGARDWKDAIVETLRRGGQNLGVIPDPETVRLRQEAKSAVPGIADSAKEALTGQMMSSFGPGNIGAGGFGIIAGRKALKAPLKKIPEAESMASMGQDPWQKTGWMRGNEEAAPWKWEINDSKSNWTSPRTNFTGNRVGDVYDHPEVYANYPELANIKVSGNIGKGNKSTGNYNHFDNTIEIYAKDHADARRLILHELQHAVQAREPGFATGTSSGAVADALKSARAKFDTIPNLQDADFAWKHYKFNKGEREPKVVEARRDMPPKDTQRINPKSMDIDPLDQFEVGDTARQIVNRAEIGAKKQPDMDRETLIKVLRNAYFGVR